MREQWIAHHREQGHEPYAAPTRENPEMWECKCDPDAVWTAVWRILTPEQIRKKFAHLGRGRNPRHRHILDEEHRLAEEHIREIWAEQEALDAARRWPDGPPLRIADRYVAGRPRRKGGRRWQ